MRSLKKVFESLINLEIDPARAVSDSWQEIKTAVEQKIGELDREAARISLETPGSVGDVVRGITSRATVLRESVKRVDTIMRAIGLDLAATAKKAKEQAAS